MRVVFGAHWVQLNRLLIKYILIKTPCAPAQITCSALNAEPRLNGAELEMTADPRRRGLVVLLADVFGSVRPDWYHSKDLIE